MCVFDIDWPQLDAPHVALSGWICAMEVAILNPLSASAKRTAKNAMNYPNCVARALTSELTQTESTGKSASHTQKNQLSLAAS